MNHPRPSEKKNQAIASSPGSSSFQTNKKNNIPDPAVELFKTRYHESQKQVRALTQHQQAAQLRILELQDQLDALTSGDHLRSEFRASVLKTQALETENAGLRNDVQALRQNLKVTQAELKLLQAFVVDKRKKELEEQVMVASSSIHHEKEEVEDAPVLRLLAEEEASKEEDETNKPVQQQEEGKDEPGLDLFLPPELSRTVTCASAVSTQQKVVSWTKQEEISTLWDADDLGHLNTLKAFFHVYGRSTLTDRDVGHRRQMEWSQEQREELNMYQQQQSSSMIPPHYAARIRLLNRLEFDWNHGVNDDHCASSTASSSSGEEEEEIVELK